MIDRCAAFANRKYGARALGVVYSGRYQAAGHLPEWDRRKESALRIEKAWKPKDFHLPNDLKGADAGG